MIKTFVLKKQQNSGHPFLDGAHSLFKHNHPWSSTTCLTDILDRQSGRVISSQSFHCPQPSDGEFEDISEQSRAEMNNHMSDLSAFQIAQLIISKEEECPQK